MKNLNDIPTSYDPKEIESKWYKIWEDGKYFKPKKGKQNESYCIIMPPPNVTGRLHAGHALDVTTQDSLIRYKRMKGFETLWLPGMDHAGIATQSVVEKLVYKEEKKTRHDFTREEFLKKIWKWKEEYGGIIASQQRCLGASPDWDYFMFTMDSEANEAVNKAFVTLYNEGLIYQSDYIINWDPVLQSAISDAEVEHKEVNGAFYNIKYKIKGSDKLLEIATTRPETLLGDTAVSVNPNDPRFNDLIGQTAIVPICNREIPIIGDEHVDIEIGTGCLKVTPGHDFNDFEIGRRHNLEIINILNKDGTLNKNALHYEGKSCKQARTEIVNELKELGLFVSVKQHVHQVGHGDRSGAIIEPLVSKQWFLNVQDMSKEAVEAIKTDKTVFYPKGWENTYFSWLNEPRNWCLSRQLWWGHQIPVFYCGECNHTWADEEKATTCSRCKSNKISQDPDVLDTWFSSSLWPMSTLGWPNEKRMKERKYDTFFPTATLATGFDIIFFWVARMMMMSLKFTKNIPFDKIYIHAIVRDKLGRKMSKSLNNGLDPLETVAEYGADAFRFTLAAGSGYNRNLNLDPERINGYRNFINKIWNAFRFIAPNLESSIELSPELNLKELSIQEKWLLTELNETTSKMNHAIDEFRFDDACSSVYSFVYDKYCSLFIEMSKPVLYGDDEIIKNKRLAVLKYGFKEMLKLLHPIAPYISEEIWSYLKDKNEDLLIIQEYPEFKSEHEFLKEQTIINQFNELISTVRNLRTSVQIKPKELIEITLITQNESFIEFSKNNQKDFGALANIQKITCLKSKDSAKSQTVMSALSFGEVHISIDGINLDEQINRLKREHSKNMKEFEKVDKKLGNEKFLKNAKEEVVAEVKLKHKEFLTIKVSIEESIKRFGGTL